MTEVHNLKSIAFGTAFLLLLAVSSAFATGSVVINEFSSGTTSDWVEIYNNSAETVDLTNYKIRDSSTNNIKEFSGNLSSGQFASISFNNWLNNNGDIVKLVQVVDGIETVLEQIAYGDAGEICAPSDTESIGKKPDGSGVAVKLLSVTRNTSNNNTPESPCPSPTPTPTPTPSPSPTPEPTSTTTPPTPVPTSSPTPTTAVIATNIPTVKPTVRPTPTEEPLVLGEETSEPTVLPTAHEAAENQTSQTFIERLRSLIPAILIVVGAVLTIGSGVPLVIQEIRGRRKLPPV